MKTIKTTKSFDKLYVQALKSIKEAKNVLIVGHINPDSDAISSVGALVELMEGINKKYTAYCQNKVPGAYSFLPHEEKILSNKDFDLKDFDLLIAVDCGSMSRTALGEEILDIKNKKDTYFKVIEFDHHPKFDDYADVEIRDSKASSTTEILYYFFRVNKISFNKNIATAILSGILTDTANFFYPSTGEQTVKISSEMLSYGAKLPKIINNVWHNKSLDNIKIWSLALNNLQINKKYSLAFSVLSYDDLVNILPKDEPFDSDIFGEVASFLSNMADVKAVMLIREQDRGIIKGSFRASAYSDEVDLSKLARLLGGGGHQKAAGFMIEGNLIKNNNHWFIR